MEETGAWKIRMVGIDSLEKTLNDIEGSDYSIVSVYSPTGIQNDQWTVITKSNDALVYSSYSNAKNVM
jgi:septum formation inhibitor-activating ATPase MinD